MDTWNLEDIYKNKEELLKEHKELIEEFLKYKPKLNELNKEEFNKLLELKEKIQKVSIKLGSKSSLKYTENTTNPENTEKIAQIREYLTESSNKLLFFSIWFKNLEENKAKELTQGKYEHYLKEIRRYKDYIKSESEEQIMNILDTTGEDIHSELYDIVTNKFTFTWENKEITQEELRKYIKSPKKEIREKAYKILLNKYQENSHLLGELYKLVARSFYNKNIKIRGFKSPIEVANYSYNIPNEVVETLHNEIKNNTKLFQEYFKLKSKILSEEITRFDLYAPFLKEEKEYSYEKSKELVLESYKEFSPEIYNKLKEVFDKNHIHVYPKKGKQSGAFCYTITNDILPYVLLNHTNKLRDVQILAHELGHASHSIESNKNPEFTKHASLPLAEVASTFGELLLSKKLLKNSSKEEKIHILMDNIENYYASIGRQGFFSLFEIEAHNAIKNGITVDKIDELYFKNLEALFGPIKVDKIFKHEWKYIPHFYHYPFYVYSYAFAQLMSLSFFKLYEENPKEFTKKYLKFLSYGGNKKPLEIFKELNIDITKKEFWQKGLNIIQEKIDELKKLL